MCYNCVDRHVKEGNGDRVAFFWEGNDVGQATTTTYKQLQDMVCQVRACEALASGGTAVLGRAGACSSCAQAGAAARPHGATTRPPAGHVRMGCCTCVQACTPAMPATRAGLQGPPSSWRISNSTLAHPPRGLLPTAPRRLPTT